MVQAPPTHRQGTPTDSADALAHGRGFRPDIQGLRAVAVALVVVYHLYPTLVPGGFVGVDVFFVISGFLITGHLLRGYRRTGKVNLLDFWGRRARRLLPAAAVVLTATWLVSLEVLPGTRLPAAAEQVRASALYFQNWVLSRNAVDYLTAEDAPSPVQHFWSLSVEEQFYLVWPLLFVIAALIGMRWRRRAGHATVFVLAAAVVTVSLAYSAHLTATNPPAAYFVTTTRIWELAAGGLLAVLPGRVISALARQGWLAWIGLVLIVGSAFVIDAGSAFPGTIATIPVGGAALMIAGGSREGRLGTWRLTSMRPMVFIGDISYSLYLWHWPIIVLWKDHSGGGIGYLDGPAIAAFAVLLSWLTKVFVEDRVRLAPFVTRHTVISLATALTVLVPVGLVAFYTPPGPVHTKLDALHPGAAVLAGDATAIRSAAVEPPFAVAQNDLQPFHSCETPIPALTARPCMFGDKSAPRLRVALIGDSVAGQWRSDLEEIATRHHWLLITDLHGECPWTATLMAKLGTNAPYRNCQQWGATVLKDMLTKFHPDVVITSARPVLGTPTHSRPDAVSFGQIADGMVTYWRRLAAANIKVVALRESPEPHRNVPDCMTRPGGTIAACTTPAAKAIYPNPPLVQAVKKMGGGAELVDMNSLICADKCSPVVGNVAVYRDTHHLTLTYATSLLPYLEKKLLATTGLHGH